MYIVISALESGEQKQSLAKGGAFNRDNDLTAPHLLFLSKAIPQCHDSHTLLLTLKLCAQWSPDSLYLWKRIAINLAVEDVQMISSSQKNFKSFISKFFRTSGSPSAFRIFKFGDHPLVSNAIGHTRQLGLLERLVGVCLICSLYAAWFCALVVLDNQHPINLQGIWSWPPLGLLCWTPWLHDTHLSLEQGCLNVLPM